MNIDLNIFKMINNLAGKNELLDQFFIYLTEFSPFIIALAFGWILFIRKGDKRENRKIVIFSVLVFVLAIAVNYLINEIYFRPRPFVNGSFNLLIDKEADSPSFPSNHATGAFAVAFAFFMRDRVLGWTFLALAALIGISRIFVGVHYPSDILAGAAIAFIACFVMQTAVNIVWPRSKRKKRMRS